MRSRNTNRHIGLSIAVAGSAAAIRLWRRRRYEISGKTVFITGGSRGLGLVLAREFAARGAKVAISARDQGALQRAAADVRSLRTILQRPERPFVNGSSALAAEGVTRQLADCIAQERQREIRSLGSFPGRRQAIRIIL